MTNFWKNGLRNIIYASSNLDGTTCPVEKRPVGMNLLQIFYVKLLELSKTIMS